MFLFRNRGYIELNNDSAFVDESHVSAEDERASSGIFMRFLRTVCFRCHPPDTTTSWRPKYWSKICPHPYCPTYRGFAQMSCIVIIMLFTWALLWTMLGNLVTPESPLFGMTICVITAYIVGWVWNKVTTLPALIGMLAVGVLFQNMGWLSIEGSYAKMSADLRKVALVVILTRAGLGLDAKNLSKNKLAIFKLGFLPWAAEGIAIAVTSFYFLNLPWSWAFLLGAMTASVSPAVVVPCLFRLQAEGFGVAKGIPTLLLAAAAIDDSISVATFGIIFSAMFSVASVTYTVLKGPLSVLVGLGFGVVMGSLVAIVPERGDTYASCLRFIYILNVGLFSVFFSNFIRWDGAGPLAVVTCSFIASLFWSKHGWKVNENPVSNAFRILWIFFEPILFAFTGAQVKISELDKDTIQLGLACLAICALLRMFVTFIVSYGTGLNKKEKVFIGITWLSKATVQAALGPVALDHVLSTIPLDHRLEGYARIILTVSILSVILAAPLSALLIAIMGPKLLSKDDADEQYNSDINNMVIRHEKNIT